MSYTTRFAPSPTGPLHLGHAYSALIAHDRAVARGGLFLLRIEDIDRDRSRPEWEALILEDLHWLGLDWTKQVMRQSTRLEAYQSALRRLASLGLLYPCRCSRADIRTAISAPQEGMPAQGPDGPVYPGTCRERRMSDAGSNDSLRLNMARVLDHLESVPSFIENGPGKSGRHAMPPEAILANIGDVVLARRDMGTSYHLSVVIDDAEQEITEVVRGADLFEATFIHALLQKLLELPTPAYFHHQLIRDEAGKRLAKRDDAKAIRKYRGEGFSPSDIRSMVGL